MPANEAALTEMKVDRARQVHEALVCKMEKHWKRLASRKEVS
jgi:hypothetical protein